MIRRNPVSQWIQTTACVAFIKITAVLPLEIVRPLGRILGRMAYYLVPRIRRVGFANLDLAYGDGLSRKEKVRILKQSAENMGIVASEFSHIPELTGDMLRKHITLKGAKHVDGMSGCLLIGAHLSNWEWMMPALTGYGFTCAGVVRPLDDPRLDACIDQTRRSSKMKTIPKENAAAHILPMLRDNVWVGILIDQSPRENGVPVHFFGEPCWATVAPIMMAVRSRIPIHVVTMIREPDGQYTLELSHKIPVTRTGDLRRDLIENSQRYQDAIEAAIRQHPGQWLWFHRRWKERPRLETEWKARLARDKPAN